MRTYAPLGSAGPTEGSLCIRPKCRNTRHPHPALSQRERVVKPARSTTGRLRHSSRAGFCWRRLVEVREMRTARSRFRALAACRLASKTQLRVCTCRPTARCRGPWCARVRTTRAARVSRVLTFLHGLLGREEDWFFEGAAGTNEQRGVKATGASIDRRPSGRRTRCVRAAARRDRASSWKRRFSGNRAGVSQVVRQFFHTNAGYEAALVLAQMEADQGHRLAAAQLYQELIDTPRAASLFEPQLSVLAALISWLPGSVMRRPKRCDRSSSCSPSAEVGWPATRCCCPLPTRTWWPG